MANVHSSVFTGAEPECLFSEINKTGGTRYNSERAMTGCNLISGLFTAHSTSVLPFIPLDPQQLFGLSFSRGSLIL